MAYVIKPIVTGELKLSKGLMTYFMNYGEEIFIPVVSWYVRAGNKNVLIDTGASAEVMARYWPGEVRDVISFEAGLARLGLKPEDTDVVIQTHLHFDHCGNTAKCRNADVYVQAEELRFAESGHPL